MLAKSLVVSDCLQPMHCDPPGSSIHGDSPGKNTGVGCHALLQRIFPTKGLNQHHLCLLHCRWILYPLTHLGSPLLCISVVYSISLLSSIHYTEGLQSGGHLDFGESRGGMKLS